MKPHCFINKVLKLIVIRTTGSSYVTNAILFNSAHNVEPFFRVGRLIIT